MPYYRWLGVTIEGKKKRGAQAALSEEALASILLNQNIAPLMIKKTQLLFKMKPPLKIRAQLYQQLLILLRAGIRFPEAVSIAATHYSTYPLLQEFLYNTASEMKEGISLSSCIKQSPLFLELEQNLFEIGEEGNHLLETMEFTAHLLTQRAIYKEKLRSVLTMPLIIAIITLGLFIGIIVFLMPQFAGFLQTSNQPLDPTIAMLIAIRSYITNPLSMLCIIIGLLCGLYFIKKIIHIKKIDACVSALKKQIPLYKTISTYSFLISFFHTLHLMLESGHTVEQSLSLIRASASKQEQQLVQAIFEKVNTGKPLSIILKDYPELFEVEDIFLMNAGELSSSSHIAAKTIYEKYSKRTDAIMENIQNYAQPVAIIVLGFFIGSMVIGIYKPILSIAMRI